MPTTDPFLPVQFSDELFALFQKYGLSVSVGLSSAGVAIRSQDPRVDAQNIGVLEAYTATEAEDTTTADTPVTKPVVETGFEPRVVGEDETSDRGPEGFASFGGRA